VTSRKPGIIGILLVSLSTSAAPAGAQTSSYARHQKLGSGHLASDSATACELHLKLAPNDIETRTKLGVLYGREKKFAKALHEFRTVLSAKPDFPPALVGMARVLSWQGNYAKSLTLYERVLRSDPANGDAAAGEAFVLLWSGRASEAELLFRGLHRRFPQDAELTEGLRRATAALAEKAAATPRRENAEPRNESYYRNRVGVNSRGFQALRPLAAPTSMPSRCRQSVEYNRQGLKLSPGDLSFELSLARSLALCQQYSEAIEQYRRYLKAQPRAEDALLELAYTLLRSRRTRESIEAFRRLLQVDPDNVGATLGLAQALAADGQYIAASAVYDRTLKAAPGNYDALQGKAFALYWARQFAPARAIFQQLAAQQPGDTQNAEALENISRADEEARWAALRPQPGAPLTEFQRFYETRLASYSDDLEALKARADIRSQLGNLPGAIRDYQQLTEKAPADADSRMELTRLLALNGQFESAMKVFRQTERSGVSIDSMERIAHILTQASRVEEAILIYEALAATSPSKPDYSLASARLEMIRKNYMAARKDLFSALAIDPQNHEAQALLAQLELAEGNWDAAAKHFTALLAHDSGDLEAVFGQARTAYYKGDLRRARSAAQTLVEVQPENFDAAFLLASIEHARGRRRLAGVLLDRAAQLGPDSSDLSELKKRLNEEAAVTVRTSVAYAREIGPAAPCPNPRGCSQLDLHEDLRTYSFGSSIETNLFPHTLSVFSIASLPSESPLGRDASGIAVPTGISGAVAPAEFLYWQTIQLSPRFGLRTGAGLVKFGPGQSVKVAGEPEGFVSAGSSVLAQGGFSYAWGKKTSIDLDLSRSPATFTPTTVRLGVMEGRLQTGLNFLFRPRTELNMIVFYSEYSSERFQYSVTVGPQRIEVNNAVQQRARGGSVTFNQNLFRSSRFSFDGGLNSSVIAFLHPSNQLPLGFFTPDLFQTHLATARFYGYLAGPLAYDLSGGMGIQQTQSGGAITRATQLSPSLTLRVNRSLSVRLGYMHYNNAQSLGSLRGNAIQLTTESKF